MGTIDIKTILQERVAVLPPEIKDLILGDAIGIVARQAAVRHGLSEEQELALENQIALVLTLFRPPSDFTYELTETLHIEHLRAEMIAEYIHDELFMIVDDILSDFWNALDVAEGKRSQQNTISALRTMEGDAERVHGYGAYRDIYPTVPASSGPAVASSSQDDLLGKRLANVPRYDESSE